MAIVLIVSLLGGTFIMVFKGISIPALRIAGRLIVALIGPRMLNPAPTPLDAARPNSSKPPSAGPSWRMSHSPSRG